MIVKRDSFCKGVAIVEMAIRPMALGDFPAFGRFEAALHAMHQQARPDLFVPCEHPT